MLWNWLDKLFKAVISLIGKYRKHPAFKAVVCLIAMVILGFGLQIYNDIKTAEVITETSVSESNTEEEQQSEKKWIYVDSYGLHLPLNIRIGKYSILAFVLLTVALGVSEYRKQKKQDLKERDDDVL